MIRILAASATLVVALTAVPAFAHVTLEVQETAVGSTYKAVLRIPHGCGTEATNVVRVQIPEGFYNVKPMPKAGWTLETVTGPYAQPYDNHGTQLTEGVTEIVWSGGDLPNEWYEEFVFRGTFASTLEPGTFYFPAIQGCATGEEAWIDVTGDENAEMPAPSVELVPAGAAGH
ncbi:YcnI family copper-binding membrane protein [Devosia riboflavina]